MSTTTATSPASPTPILDRLAALPKMERPLQRSIVPLAILYGVAIAFTGSIILWHPPLLTALAMWVGARVAPILQRQWNIATSILFALQCLASLFAAVAIHEIGHCLAGVLVGFRFNSLRIGPVQFDRPFRISLYRGRGTGAGGWASLFPVTQDKLVPRTIAMLLAGPASNFLSCLFFLPYSKGPFALWFLYWSILLGSFNLLPFRSRAVISDGGRILMLLRSQGRGERWLAILRLVEELRTGVPYEKLTPAFLAKAVAIEDDSPDTVVAFGLAYGVAFWQRKDDEAARALETCLRHSNLAAPATRQALMSDAAVFQARRRQRIDLAEQWLADIPEKTELGWMRMRGDAGILEAKRDIEGALRKLDEIEAMILAFPNQAVREISLGGVRRWRLELRQQTVTTRT